MALPPQKMREAVLQMLFSAEFGEVSDEMIAMMMQELKTTRSAMAAALARVQAIVAKKGEIDEMISKQSTEYSLDRISNVEKTVLRLSIFELLFDKDLPPLVAISEGVRLTRKFGTKEGSEFVNAILDGVYKNAVSKEPAPL